MIETLELFIFQIVLGYCLQGLIFVLGMYTFNQQKIILKNYISASALFIVTSYIIRLLPISFGVHTIINMLILVIICIVLLKMPVFNTIRSMSIVMVFLLLSEMADLAVLTMVMGKDKFEEVMHNPLQKAITGIPSNVLFLLLITLSYYILKKKGDSNRKVSL